MTFEVIKVEKMIAIVDINVTILGLNLINPDRLMPVFKFGQAGMGFSIRIDQPIDAEVTIVWEIPKISPV